MKLTSSESIDIKIKLLTIIATLNEITNLLNEAEIEEENK